MIAKKFSLIQTFWVGLVAVAIECFILIIANQKSTNNLINPKKKFHLFVLRFFFFDFFRLQNYLCCPNFEKIEKDETFLNNPHLIGNVSDFSPPLMKKTFDVCSGGVNSSLKLQEELKPSDTSALISIYIFFLNIWFQLYLYLLRVGELFFNSFLGEKK